MFNFFSDIIKDYSGELGLPNYIIVSYGGSLAYVEGVKKLLEVNENEIIIKVKKGDITIKGNKLKIKEYLPGVVAVIGQILSVGENNG